MNNPFTRLPHKAKQTLLYGPTMSGPTITSTISSRASIRKTHKTLGRGETPSTVIPMKHQPWNKQMNNKQERIPTLWSLQMLQYPLKKEHLNLNIIHKLCFGNLYYKTSSFHTTTGGSWLCHLSCLHWLEAPSWSNVSCHIGKTSRWFIDFSPPDDQKRMQNSPWCKQFCLNPRLPGHEFCWSIRSLIEAKYLGMVRLYDMISIKLFLLQ